MEQIRTEGKPLLTYVV